MSEQIQNQNILNEEEMRARDDAIFDTVAEFRNDIDNPALPEVPEFSNIDQHDAANKPVDVNAIFDAHKPSTNRHRKAFDEQQNMDAIKEIAVYGKPRGKHAGAPAEHQEAYGMAAKASDDDIAARRNSKGSARGTTAETPAELTEDGELDPDALARAEAAVRAMPRRTYTDGSREENYGFDSPDAGGTATPAPATQHGRHRRTRSSSPSTDDRHRLIGENGTFRGDSDTTPTPEANANPDSQGVVVGVPRGRGFRPGTRAAQDGAVVSSTGPNGPHTGVHVIGENGELIAQRSSSDSENGPVTVTPEARRRDKIIARLGKMINKDQVLEEVRTARAEVAEAWRAFRQGRRDRRGDDLAIIPDPDRTREGILARHGNKLTTAVALAGATAVAAAGVAHYNAMNETANVARPAVSSTPNPGESAPQYGPQVPKTSETPTPSASVTKKPTSKPTVKPTIAGPTAVPSTPDFSNKPHVEEEPKGPASTAEKQQTKDLDHETISFTTKDGKVVRASATLKSGGSIFEAGHDAGLTDTEVANAVNQAGITGQQAESLPVGQQIDFNQQADGSYVVNLR